MSEVKRLTAIYCEAWEASFLAANPYHSVTCDEDDKRHIEAGVAAVIADHERALSAECDQLRARVEELETENMKLRIGFSDMRGAARFQRSALESLRASIVALAAGWDAMAKNHDHLMRITDSSVIMAEHRTAAHMFREHATELRQLGEGNGRD